MLLQYTIGMFVVQFMILLLLRGFICFCMYWIFKLIDTFSLKAFVSIYNGIMQVGNIVLSVLLAAFITGKNANLGLANLVAGAVLGVMIFIESYITAFIMQSKLKQ